MSGGPVHENERLYIHSDLGTLVRVTAIFYGEKGADESNTHMERGDNNDAVLAVYGDRIYLAEVDDLGFEFDLT
jgi:hypothetical protein